MNGLAIGQYSSRHSARRCPQENKQVAERREEGLIRELFCKTGAPLAGTVTQPVGRLRSVTATFATTTTCARSQPWTALAQPGTGKFAGGAATVNVAPPASFSMGNLVGCTDPSATAMIKLQG